MLTIRLSEKRFKELYASFCTGQIVVTDIKNAEMTKAIENTFRCVNIAFANELTKICRHDGMNVYELNKICNMHPRVNILNSGPGVGGHSIPDDPLFLVGDYPSLAEAYWGVAEGERIYVGVCAGADRADHGREGYRGCEPGRTLWFDLLRECG